MRVLFGSMKKLSQTFLLFILLFTSQSHALLVEFVGPCEATPFAAKLFTDVSGQSLAALTKIAAQDREIPMTLSIHGMFKFFGEDINPKATTTMDNIKIGFGWCYLVNGQASSVSAAEYFPHQEGRITWVHSYSVNILGEWQTSASCVPTYQKYSDKFCSK